MRGRPTRTIGFLVYDIVNPFFANLAAGIEDSAHERGFNVVICSSHPWKSSGREQSYMQMLLQRQIDGLVLQHVFSSPDYATLLERQGIPAVRVLNPQPGYPYDLVRCDTKQGTCDLVRHLLQFGTSTDCGTRATDALFSRHRSIFWVSDRVGRGWVGARSWISVARGVAHV